MLEEPPAELPARASAIAGARARVAAMNTASRMRQFSSGFDIATLVRKFRETRIRPIWARAQAGGSITRYRAVDFPAGAGPARAGRLLDCRLAGPKYSCWCTVGDRRRTGRPPTLARYRGERC